MTMRLRLATAATIAAALWAQACVTPELPQPPEPEETPDAAPLPPDAKLDCELRHDSVGDGHHNPGTECLSCHNGQQAGAPIFTLGGTAYVDKSGTQPLVGATVIVIDANGTVAKLPTQRNGNFYTSAALVPPFATGVSECPTNVQMISNFTDGDCNTCHASSGDPGRVNFTP